MGLGTTRAAPAPAGSCIISRTSPLERGWVPDAEILLSVAAARPDASDAADAGDDAPLSDAVAVSADGKSRCVFPSVRL